jgi:uncharacterized membrane protein YeaQ/YmgE (transglycosylase-associated protein family)
MSIIWTIIIGFIVGIVARLLLPGRDPAGFIVTTVLGILGSVGGHYVGVALGMYRDGEPAGFLMSVITAMALLLVHRAFRSDHTRPTAV